MLSWSVNHIDIFLSELFFKQLNLIKMTFLSVTPTHHIHNGCVM